jgi:hypothetical protein
MKLQDLDRFKRGTVLHEEIVRLGNSVNLLKKDYKKYNRLIFKTDAMETFVLRNRMTCEQIIYALEKELIYLTEEFNKI